MLSRTCSKCNHRVAGRAVRCLYCGEFLGLPEKPPSRPCPRCRKTLETVPAQWVAIDRCDSCRGEFYDRGEVEGVLKLDDRGVRWLGENVEPRRAGSGPETPLECPGCRAAMRAFLIPAAETLVIDICPKCRGTWLDGGEPEKLRRAIQRGQVPTIKMPESMLMADVSFSHQFHRGHGSGLVSNTVTGAAGELGIELLFDAIVDGLLSG
jgi:Zn-finger nucleic acid-binding protein